jgi:ATP-dependent DNA ligase
MVTTSQGLYCPAGAFHIDPRQRVEQAVIAHAHSDHLRPVRQRESVHVFELAFEGIARSPRHKSGVALRFARILR